MLWLFEVVVLGGGVARVVVWRLCGGCFVVVLALFGVWLCVVWWLFVCCVYVVVCVVWGLIIALFGDWLEVDWVVVWKLCGN